MSEKGGGRPPFHPLATTLTTDYIIIDARHAPLAVRCETYDHHSLNFSDHLPLSLTLSLIPTANPITMHSQPRFNWQAAIERMDPLSLMHLPWTQSSRPHLGISQVFNVGEAI